MLKLNTSEAAAKFRHEFRSWLEKNHPETLPTKHTLEEFIAVARRWQKKLAEARWVGVHWEERFGGRSLSLVEEAIIQEELVRVQSPQLLGLFGLTMVGPVLIKHGQEWQKERFLSKILAADEIWCQGFSEPGAGSDLAAIKTRAVPAEKGWLLTGQKVWTSFAQIADWCFVLCRTSDEPKKHQGMSYMLVDMRSPGITTRPLKQMSGDAEFNEVFFDQVFVPSENIVGQAGQGWEIAISTLMYERVVLTFARQLQSEALLRDLVERYGQEKSVSTSLKERIGFEVARACAVRALAYEHLLSYAAGATPGPEGSLDKLFWSESFQSICQLALDLQGPKAIFSEDSKENGADMHRYLYSRGRTIAAGTSEIQRSIIAERLLDLPRLASQKNS